MRKRIRTAVIGGGNMGKNHVRIYSEISDLVAIAEIIPEIGMPLAKKYKVPYYSKYEEMLDEMKPEAVSVVVPTKYHAQVVTECLSRHIPTLVEKPITATVEEADKLIALAKLNKVYLMVGHVERFNPAVIRLKKLIDNEKIGKIVALLAMRVGLVPPKAELSDVALDLGIHDIDIFNYLLDEIPKSHKVIRSKLFTNNISDAAAIMLEYSHTTAFVQTNWITPIKMRKLYVTGTEGFAELDYISQKVSIYHKHLLTKKNGDYLDLIALSNQQKKQIYISKKEPLREELKFFLNNINKIGKLDSNAVSSKQAISIVLGV